MPNRMNMKTLDHANKFSFSHDFFFLRPFLSLQANPIRLVAKKILGRVEEKILKL
jgi:hypothetical protein